jgi:flagellar basal-body rod protein FlgG
MSTYGIYTSGLGALGQSARVDQIANNLANLNTPAFRADRLSFQERLVEALEGGHPNRYYNALVHRNGGAPFIGRTVWDREAGGFEVTGRPLDFALSGRGFFTVRDPETGREYYTRAGNFATDSAGRLVTADGRYQVLTEDGRGVALDPAGSSDVRLREDGTLFQGELEVGRLGIVDFADPSRIVKRGDTLFQDLGAAPSPVESPSARQGTLERSSVEPISEMVEMIKALRSLEANLQMIRFQDQTLERAVNDLGRMPR